MHKMSGRYYFTSRRLIEATILVAIPFNSSLFIGVSLAHAADLAPVCRTP